jgi:cytosine/adenosine deaminase-related metal-dependent hydrolase
MSLLVRAGVVVTGTGREVAGGWILCQGGMIDEIGSGDPPRADEHLNLQGCIAVPGLVNSHDHLYQWATRGYAPDSGLFDWLRTLYPVWTHIDAELVATAARAAMARLLLAGCTQTTDHHYVFPAGRPGIFEALVTTARDLGIRFHPCRGSMSRGASQGGLPPDELVEDEDEILAATELMAAKFHDGRPGSMCRVAVAPCSPFTVSPRLMRESAELGRRLGLRLHTHIAETLDEEAHCVERYGLRPVELLEELGWVGDDVWLAHGVHLTGEEVTRLGSSGTGIAHCPSSNMRLGSGACPVTALLAAGAPVGLGVDGSASNEDYNLVGEIRQALLLARLRAAMLDGERPAAAMDARTALMIATAGGSACLGRGETGALDAGYCADIALYSLDDMQHTAIDDAVTALTLAPPCRAEAVVVDGRIVVRNGSLLTGDETKITRDLARAGRRLRDAAQA